MLKLCPLFLSDTPRLDNSDTDGVSSPRVIARQRVASTTSSETPTPHTPKSSRPAEDRHFFGSNFNLDALAHVASLHRPTLGE